MDTYEKCLLYVCVCIFILYNIIVGYLISYIWRLKKNFNSCVLRNPSSRRDVKVDNYSVNGSSNQPTQLSHENIQSKKETGNLDQNNLSNEKTSNLDQNNVSDNMKDIEENLQETEIIIKKPHLLHRRTHRFSNVIEQLKKKRGIGDLSRLSKEDGQCILNSVSSLQGGSNTGEKAISADVNIETDNVMLNLETVNLMTNPDEVKTQEKSNVPQAMLLPDVLEELKEKTTEKNCSISDARSDNLDNGSVNFLQEIVNECKRNSETNEKSLTVSQKNTSSDNDAKKASEICIIDTDSNTKINNDGKTQFKDKKSSNVLSGNIAMTTTEPLYDLLPNVKRKILFELDNQYSSFQSLNSPDIKENYVNAKVSNE